MAQQDGKPGLTVGMAQIIDQLHAKYGRMVAQLMQENAELQAGVEQLAALAEQQGAELAALQQPVDPWPTPGTPAHEVPNPAGLFPGEPGKP